MNCSIWYDARHTCHHEWFYITASTSFTILRQNKQESVPT